MTFILAQQIFKQSFKIILDLENNTITPYYI